MRVLALLLAFLGGCTLVKKTVEAPISGLQSLFSIGQSKATLDPVDLQEDLFRYSDNLTSVAVRSAAKLEKGGQPIPRADLLMIKIGVVGDVLSTATGPNAYGNLVDMIVLASALRIRIEEYWLPKIYGKSARRMLETFQEGEKEIWLLAESVMTPAQRQELRSAIERWRLERKEHAISISAFAGLSLVSKIVESARNKADPHSTSVFRLLDIDPLAGLDPATRELAQTRLLAERAMFLGQRMPTLLQWQVELLGIRMAELPQVEQAVSSAAQIAAAGERLGKLAEQFPGLVSSERKEVFQGLGREQERFFKSIGTEREKLLAALQKPGLGRLSREIGTTFGEGARMAASADTALKTFDGVMARFDKEPSEAAEPEVEPFRIKDYADTAGEIGRMSERLTELVEALQPNLAPEAFARLSAATETVTGKIEAQGKEVVDYAFLRGLQLVAAVFAAALAYRVVVARWLRRDA